MIDRRTLPHRRPTQKRTGVSTRRSSLPALARFASPRVAMHRQAVPSRAVAIVELNAIQVKGA